jgi:sarcosine/dimethylglycine N-methyltransferase
MDSIAESVKAYYAGAEENSVTERVRALLSTFGPDGRTSDRLVALDHFHVRGAEATAELASLTDIQPGWRALNAGSGLGGPSRYLAATHDCLAEGIDLTPSFVEVARLLAEREKPADRVHYAVEDATALSFPDAHFDLVWCEHVATNVADRAKLYSEFHRVLRLGGVLAFYDVVAIEGAEEPAYPLPWSETSTTRFLLSREATFAALADAGFKIRAVKDASRDALDWFQRVGAVSQPGPNISVVMGPRMGVMVPNLARNVSEGRLGLLMGVAEAR